MLLVKLQFKLISAVAKWGWARLGWAVHLMTRPRLAVERRMRLEMRWVGGVRGRHREIHCSQTGMAWLGHSTPDSKKRGKMRAREAWIA